MLTEDQPLLLASQLLLTTAFKIMCRDTTKTVYFTIYIVLQCISNTCSWSRCRKELVTFYVHSIELNPSEQLRSGLHGFLKNYWLRFTIQMSFILKVCFMFAETMCFCSVVSKPWGLNLSTHNTFHSNQKTISDTLHAFLQESSA
jgi:hypothetical protein